MTKLEIAGGVEIRETDDLEDSTALYDSATIVERLEEEIDFLEKKIEEHSDIDTDRLAADEERSLAIASTYRLAQKRLKDLKEEFEG